MRDDPVHGTSDILGMAFLSPALSSWDISFSVADDHMGSDHFPIQISLDKPLKRTRHLLNHVTDLTKRQTNHWKTV